MPTQHPTIQLYLFAEKHCSKCREFKAVALFYTDRSRRDGLSPWCKECLNVSNRKWAQAHPGEVREILQRYRTSETYKGRMARLKADAEQQQRRRAYERARSKRLHVKQRKAAYRARNRAQIRAREKRWIRLHYARHRAYRNAYRVIDTARKRQAPGRCSPKQLLDRLAYYGWKCWMCAGAADTVDHVKPLRHGGANWPANLRPACRSCNSRKGATWPWKL